MRIIDNAPQNMAVIRQMALNLLKKEKTAKGGLQSNVTVVQSDAIQ
jgi:hypothetical protein